MIVLGFLVFIGFGFLGIFWILFFVNLVFGLLVGLSLFLWFRDGEDFFLFIFKIVVRSFFSFISLNSEFFNSDLLGFILYDFEFWRRALVLGEIRMFINIVILEFKVRSLFYF